MEKVGVYCRLSDEDRYKKNKNDDSESIANQKSMLLTKVGKLLTFILMMIIQEPE